MAKPAYLLVRVHRNLIPDLRNLLHASNLIEGDIPFYGDGYISNVSSPTRDAALAKYDRLATVYDTSMNYTKRFRDRFLEDAIADLVSTGHTVMDDGRVRATIDYRPHIAPTPGDESHIERGYN